MKKFEYKTLKVKEDVEGSFFSSTPNALNSEKTELYLNKLGFEGWELVSVFDTNLVHGSTNEIIFVFKREILS
jgi:hypothetical protein